MASFSLLEIMEVAFISDSLCQGSYEAAVESGVKNQAACKRTKQILQIRKQDSYTKAIGGSFEDDHGSEGKGGGGGGGGGGEPAVKMRKQESYLMAVGELVSLGFFLAFKMVSRKIFHLQRRDDVKFLTESRRIHNEFRKQIESAFDGSNKETGFLPSGHWEH